MALGFPPRPGQILRKIWLGKLRIDFLGYSRERNDRKSYEFMTIIKDQTFLYNKDNRNLQKI